MKDECIGHIQPCYGGDAKLMVNACMDVQCRASTMNDENLPYSYVVS